MLLLINTIIVVLFLLGFYTRVVKDIIINSLTELISLLFKDYSNGYAFRGVPDASYKLLPKIARNEYRNNKVSKEDITRELLLNEQKILNEFVKMSIPYQDLREYNVWEQLSIGQHFGLPTILLDWTLNPMIATYFAVASKNQTDAAIYVLSLQSLTLVENEDDSVDPFNLGESDSSCGVFWYKPPYINPRITSQKGIFTISADPFLPLETIPNIEIVKLIIKSHKKESILNHLDFCGINESFVYPGIEGVAKYVDSKWRRVE